MTVNEQALTFQCEGETLLGVLSSVAVPAPRGVLVVVGGPQSRAGSHRQFTLLARHLAEQGVPALRFDYRGMGDSPGAPRTFENVSSDIRCAIDIFFNAVPGLKDVVIWGLCDAASAALFYAHQDTRVSGVVLLNPWVHTEHGRARVYLRHYYVRRLFQSSFWRKVTSGEFRVGRAASALGKLVVAAVGREPSTERGVSARERGGRSHADARPFPARMEEGLRRFRGRVLLILSGNDFSAQEFKDLVAGSASWRRLLAHERVTRHELAEANHTFARREWRDQVAQHGLWISCDPREVPRLDSTEAAKTSLQRLIAIQGRCGRYSIAPRSRMSRAVPGPLFAPCEHIRPSGEDRIRRPGRDLWRARSPGRRS